LLSGNIYAFALLSVVATSDFICTCSGCSPEAGDKKGNQKILFPQITVYAAGDIADCRKNRPRNLSPHAPQI
jgi:hypothetical protein